MNIIYITLNNAEEAEKVGRRILQEKLANCVNYFPITCIYNYEGTITKEPEVVLLVKTQNGRYADVEQTIKEMISYENFIGELTVNQVNDEFTAWLTSVVPS